MHCNEKAIDELQIDCARKATTTATIEKNKICVARFEFSCNQSHSHFQHLNRCWKIWSSTNVWNFWQFVLKLFLAVLDLTQQKCKWQYERISNEPFFDLTVIDELELNINVSRKTYLTQAVATTTTTITIPILAAAYHSLQHFLLNEYQFLEINCLQFYVR